MLSICVLFEDVVRRRDIAGGIGGNLGRYEGMLMGGLVGSVIGAKASGASTSDMDFDSEDMPLGQSAGMYFGAGLGSALGGQIGRAIGRGVISNPDAPADFSKPSHRVGYLADPNTKWYGALADIVHPGSASVVGGLRNAISSNGAKRLGYGAPGRIAQALTVLSPIDDAAPLLGIIPPEKVAKNKKKNK